MLNLLLWNTFRLGVRSRLQIKASVYGLGCDCFRVRFQGSVSV